MSSNTAVPLSCTECKRRKQKCNREFPCGHCLKRGVSHRCKFEAKPIKLKASKEQPSFEGQPRTSRKRSLDGPEHGALSDGDPDQDDSCSDIDVSSVLNGMGYMSHHHHLVLGQGHGPKAVRDSTEESDGEQSDELKAALQLIPDDKRYTDCLVDNWLSGANHQYYALYPPEFRTQYNGWWAAPRNKVTAEVTSLILRVCACSLHFMIEDHVRVRLETELDTDALTLSNRMHAAAEKLSASIPPGKGGLVHVQQLFLTAFWFKSAEKFTESWHALSKAIRAANEIGLHQDSLSDGMSEFDREMRRRIWVILYLWDFALSSMLSRPLLVNHADCTVVMPTLNLENHPSRPGQPSPFRHMNLHCQLCIDMAAQLGGRPGSDADKAEIANRMRKVVDAWFERLPVEYAVKVPDTRWDGEFNWVVFQRRYLHLIGFMSLFSQLRPFIIRSSARPMSDLEFSLREAGVEAALGLMDASWRLFENLVSVGAKFHYAIFCIFDVATVMCSGFLQDEARNLPKREAVLEAIKKALSMLAEVAPESKTTAALYRILKGLLTKLPLNNREQGVIGAPKRAKNEMMTPPRDKTPVVKSPSKSPVKSALSGTRRRHGHPPRSTSTSPDTDSTPDSPNFQPRSERSASSPGSHSINVQVPSSVQAQSSHVVPSNGVARVSGLPSPGSFVPSTPLHPTYPNTTESFMPTTSSMSVTAFMASGGYPGPPAFPTSTGFQYGTTLNPVDAVPFSQPGWQPTLVPMDGPSNDVQSYQAGNPVGLDSTAPEVLSYWEWQSLGLGNPVSWGQPPVHVETQGGIRHQPGMSGGFNGRGIASGGEGSSGTDDPSR